MALEDLAHEFPAVREAIQRDGIVGPEVILSFAT
jgi:hypothetical protein